MCRYQVHEEQQVTVAAQTPDGCWWPGSPYCNDATAEMVVWLDEIHQAVGSGWAPSSPI